MPQIKAAKKSLRSDAKKRLANDRWRKAVRQAIRTVQEAISAGDKQTAETAYTNAQKAIDRAARRNIIHKNKAARKKSQLQKQVTELTT